METWSPGLINVPGKQMRYRRKTRSSPRAGVNPAHRGGKRRACRQPLTHAPPKHPGIPSSTHHLAQKHPNTHTQRGAPHTHTQTHTQESPSEAPPPPKHREGSPSHTRTPKHTHAGRSSQTRPRGAPHTPPKHTGREPPTHTPKHTGSRSPPALSEATPHAHSGNPSAAPSHAPGALWRSAPHP